MSFARILALDYYDGPRAGVAQCVECRSVYKFELVDEDLNYESGEDVRIFHLALLPSAALDELLAVCPHPDEACWPIWVPLWQFDSQAQQQAADNTADGVLRQAGSANYVVASADGLRTMIACRPVTSRDASSVRDWFRYLGLTRREGADGA